MTSSAFNAGRDELAAIIDAVPGLCKRGALILPCDGKRPIHAGWQNRKYTVDDIIPELCRVANPMIGLRFGPGSCIDIEADSPEEEIAFTELFAGCDVPTTPILTSTRGKHRLFAWNDRLGVTGAAVVSYCGTNGAKLGIRIGAGDKGAQSIIPPSPGRKWLVNWDDCELAKLPDVVTDRILAAAKQVSNTPTNVAPTSGLATLEALAAMIRIKPSANEHDGSRRLLAVCCRAVEHALSDEAAIAAIREYKKLHPFPRNYSDDEILIRLRDAEEYAKRGSAVVITNYEMAEVEDAVGNNKLVAVPLPLNTIIDTINTCRQDWPRRVDKMLFIDDPEHGLDYFNRRMTAALFGWLRRHSTVQWMNGGNYVSQDELFAELARTQLKYNAIELLPHEPPIAGIYYCGKAPVLGDGLLLQRLLALLRPATTIDRSLIQAMIMTAFWGGLPGCRPAFVITSDDGRGVGKTKVAEVVSYLCGGHIDVSAGEDFQEIKTRMLTLHARRIRIALLDNVKTMRMSWAELEAMITAPIISGRQLYVGEGQRPNLLTWIITLNGVSMATDMSQRSVIIKVVKGKNDGTWWEKTRQFIDQCREQIIGDIIAALRGEQFPLTDYSRWAKWYQEVLC